MFQRRHDEALGRYQHKQLPFMRRVSMQAFDAIPPGHNMMALVDLDITDAQALVQAQRERGRRTSLFAFMVKSIAMALAEHPQLNALRSGADIIEFEDIDVNIPIELGGAPRQLVIRRADHKSTDEVYREIHDAKHSHHAEGSASQEDRKAVRMMKLLLLLPKFLRNAILRRVMNDAFMVKRMSGTTFVTSVSKFAQGMGFALPFAGGPRAVSFALGGVARKPVVIGDEVRVRECLSMTIVFNHDIVDGAPAARFTSRLKELVESAAALR
ncbi:2-oxo acid dehydrogenase subunit E2 [Haliangium sp.]|uniref:2-oxo acid dehydrogenase subunit E2 n=1 Tax=Haliangium sp. TaxID=2663208 RepID=UPI003D0E4784